MNITISCYPCILNMVLSISRLSGFDKGQTDAIMDYTLKLLLELRESGLVPPPVVARYIFRKAAVISGHPAFYDPYKELKKGANAAVTAFYPELEKSLKNDTAPIETAIRLSALGNILDFAIIDPSSIDISKEVASARELVFEKYDYPAFSALLLRAKHVLILGDNAGEIVFDKLLVNTLKEAVPGLTVTYAVRHAPVLNDVTLEDAFDIGMDRVATVISSGSACPGTCLDETSPSFNHLFETADLVISKGQGNYETLNAISRENLFFIFRVKCKQVAEAMNAPSHSLVLLRS